MSVMFPAVQNNPIICGSVTNLLEAAPLVVNNVQRTGNVCKISCRWLRENLPEPIAYGMGTPIFTIPNGFIPARSPVIVTCLPMLVQWDAASSKILQGYYDFTDNIFKIGNSFSFESRVDIYLDFTYITDDL